MTDAIEKLIDRYGPERVCAALEPLLTADRIERIDTVLSQRLGSIATAVEDTYDPHNAAATMRTSEALGLQELHVIEPGNRFSTAQGVTRGAHRWIDLHRWPTPDAAVAGLHARGFRIYATLPTQDSVTIEEVDISTPLAIVFGNEHAGVSKEIVEACDGAITVPMFGFTESYNLSVTVGLAMGRLAQRRRAFLGTTGDLDPARIARLRARWFAIRIRASVKIVERALG